MGQSSQVSTVVCSSAILECEYSELMTHFADLMDSSLSGELTCHQLEAVVRQIANYLRQQELESNRRLVCSASSPELGKHLQSLYRDLSALLAEASAGFDWCAEDWQEWLDDAELVEINLSALLASGGIVDEEPVSFNFRESDLDVCHPL